jgi:hypothetical protein
VNAAAGVRRESYRSLDLAFTVVAPPDFATTCAAVFRGCRRASDQPPGASVHYDVEVDDAGTITLRRDGAEIERTTHRAYALDYLVWDVNQQVVAASSRRLLLHCGAVARGRDAVLVGARSGGGKSTLSAALVRRGFAYATDECVAVAPDGTIEGHGKAIGLERGAWPLLDDVLPPAPADLHETSSRYLTPVDQAGDLLVPRVVVLRGDDDGGDGVLTPLTRAETLAALARLGFNFRRFGAARLPTLARLVERCDCYRLTTRDLDVAVDAIEDALGAVVSG